MDPKTQQIPVVIYTSQRLESGERERLQAAADIVPKETQSRELTEARFAEALARAGVHIKLKISDGVGV
jgi:hypothetical protein